MFFVFVSNFSLFQSLDEYLIEALWKTILVYSIRLDSVSTLARYCDHCCKILMVFTENIVELGQELFYIKTKSALFCIHNRSIVNRSIAQSESEISNNNSFFLYFNKGCIQINASPDSKTSVSYMSGISIFPKTTIQ